MTAHPPGAHRLANQRIAARRIGCTLEHYLAQRAAGLRWCSGCRKWRRRVSRNWCGQCRARSQAARRAGTPRPPRPSRPPRPQPPRHRPGLRHWLDPASPWMASVVEVVVDQRGMWGRRG